MSRRYTFKLTIEPDDDMGLDDACDVQDAVEEAIRDTGMDNAANIKLVLIEQLTLKKNFECPSCDVDVVVERPDGKWKPKPRCIDCKSILVEV